MAGYYELRYGENGQFAEKLQRMSRDTLSRNADYEPVTVSSNARKICQSWWGDAWCRNLERYADENNRIERGKNYLRVGAVVDLKINGGEIFSRVQGSWRTPFSVHISIAPMDIVARKQIEWQATGKIRNVEALLNGEFPEELKDLFFRQNGLFPSPREIHFSCNCPDSAHMCKHIAATLFGVGVKLDSNPLDFFRMRAINIDDFAKNLIGGKVESMLRKARRITTPRIMKRADLSRLFGI